MDSKFSEEPETETTGIQAGQQTQATNDDAEVVPLQFLVKDDEPSLASPDETGFDETTFDHLEDNSVFRGASSTVKLDTDSDLIDLNGEDLEKTPKLTDFAAEPEQTEVVEQAAPETEDEEEAEEQSSESDEDDDKATTKRMPRNRTTRMMSSGGRNTTKVNATSTRRDTTRIKAEDENVPAWVKRKRERNKKNAKLIIVGIEVGLLLGGILLITFALPRFLPTSFPNGLPPWSWILPPDDGSFDIEAVPSQTPTSVTTTANTEPAETETSNEITEAPVSPKKTNVDPSTFRTQLDKLIEMGKQVEKLRNEGESQAAMDLLKKFYLQGEKLSDQMFDAGEERSDIGLEYNKLFKKYSDLEASLQSELGGGGY